MSEPLERITYRSSGAGSQEKTSITDSAGNKIAVSREYDRGLQASPEKYQLICSGASGESLTPGQFLEVLDKLHRYDTKLPWENVAGGKEKIYNVPTSVGLLAKKCNKRASELDL